VVCACVCVACAYVLVSAVWCTSRVVHVKCGARMCVVCTRAPPEGKRRGGGYGPAAKSLEFPTPYDPIREDAQDLEEGHLGAVSGLWPLHCFQGAGNSFVKRARGLSAYR